MKFKNMKIAITDEVHLKAVCDVLESMGYKPYQPSPCNECAYTWDDGFYCLDKHMDSRVIYDSVTLTELLAMRDQLFMESLK